MVMEEDGEGEKKAEEREEEERERGASGDEGEGGSIQVSDPSVHVTGEEEECRVEGERVKNKQKNHKGRRRGENAVHRSEERGYRDLGS